MTRASNTFLCSILLIMLDLSLTPVGVAKASGHTRDGAPDEITQVLTLQQTAWNNGDIPGFMRGYWESSELSFSGSDGVSRGWDKVLARYKQNYPDKAAMGHLDFTDVEVRTLSDAAALVLGKWHLKRATGDIGGVFTLVFQQFPEGWKIIHDHTSQVVQYQP